VRALALDTPAGSLIWKSIAWSVGMLVVFAPLAVARYRRAV
jgi:hypothetical protein